MCGIIGYTGDRAATPLLLEGLRKLEYRGYDSAGVAVLDSQAGTTTNIRRCEGKIAGLTELVQEQPVAGHCGIGHTRWATHGKPSERNAHPHRAGKVSLVHNGIIENYQALRADLANEGRSFSSDTDTELVAHLVERAYEGDLLEALRTAIEGIEGAYSLCVLHEDHPEQIAVARLASPLLIGLVNDPERRETFIASDAAAMLAHTRTVVDLDDGDVALIGPEGISTVVDAAGKSVRRPVRQIEWSPLAAEKQGFKHFMLKEIFEQPRAIRDTIASRVKPGQAGVTLEDFAFELGDDPKLTMLACGTSWHAALSGKYLVERLARVPVEVDLASEYRYRDPIVRQGEIALAISQSGETADTLAALKEAMRRGAKGLAICNVIDSTIARAADAVLYTRAGPEISVASTKAFTTQLTVLTMLAVDLGRRTGSLSEAAAIDLVNALHELPVAVDTVLDVGAAIKTIARRYVNARDVLYLGRGPSFPVALEGALKLKEISYIHAEGYASGEMKHGPIALIDELVPVVVLALEGPGYAKALANVDQVRSRGGKVIAIATVGDERIGDLADDVILIPPTHELLQPLLANVPLQLLAYYIADLKGTDVDQPRNLAKSVTVE